MRRWLNSILCVVVVTGVGVGGPARAFAKSVEPAPVVRGGAFVRASDGDDFAPANDGTSVTPGNAVRSGATRGARLDIAEGVYLKLAPSTSVTVRSSSWLPAEHPGASPVRALQVALMSGELDLFVREPKGEIGVTILLPGGRSVAIWRGSANVAIDDGDRVAFALYDGMAIAGAGTRWQPLSAGKGVVLGAKNEITGTTIPTKPQWASDPSVPSSFALVRGGEGGVVGAAWAPIPGAASYRLELARDAEMAGDVTVTSSTTPTFRSDPLAAGSYALRVRGVSADGLVGPASSPTTLRVAHVSLPKGAFAAQDGNVVLPEGGALELDDPTGLEVATVVRHDMPDDALFWTPAATRIPLGPGDRREIRIRNAASHTKTSFVLVRRTLHAHISFSPKPARWPGSAVEIIVKVQDPSGYLDATRELVDVDARLDIDRLNLQWQHNGDTWIGRVPSQTGAGPWVIRVDVKDSAGTSIGSSLLDVDGPAGDHPALRQAVFTGP